MSLSSPPQHTVAWQGLGPPQRGHGAEMLPWPPPAAPALSTGGFWGDPLSGTGPEPPQERCRASRPPPHTDTQGPASHQPHAVTSSRAVAHHRSAARVPPPTNLLSSLKSPKPAAPPNPKKAGKGPEAEEGTALPFGLSRGDSQRRGHQTVTAVPPRPPRVLGATLLPQGSAQHQGGGKGLEIKNSDRAGDSPGQEEPTGTPRWSPGVTGWHGDRRHGDSRPLSAALLALLQQLDDLGDALLGDLWGQRSR